MPNEPKLEKVTALAKTRRHKCTQTNGSNIVFGDRGQQMMKKTLRTFAALRPYANFLVSRGRNPRC